MTYHNTTNQVGQTLLTFTNKARTQDEDVLNYFKANPNDQHITPEKVVRYLRTFYKRYEDGAIIISIRRSFNTLMNLGWIEKSGMKLQGSKGRIVNSWRLKRN